MAHVASAHTFWREANNRLDRLLNRVREGQGLDEAVEFARWLRNSRVFELLQDFDNQGCLKVDTALLRWKTDELERQVTQRYASGKFAPKPDTSHLEQINHKLDLIAGHLSKFPIAETAGPETGCGPNLSVITGGASGDGEKGGEKNDSDNLPAKRHKVRKQRMG